MLLCSNSRCFGSVMSFAPGSSGLELPLLPVSITAKMAITPKASSIKPDFIYESLRIVGKGIKEHLPPTQLSDRAKGLTLAARAPVGLGGGLRPQCSFPGLGAVPVAPVDCLLLELVLSDRKAPAIECCAVCVEVGI